MARIRSVHPGLFTDEAFAFISDAAQIFIIGLWTECDDQGAFEWKPGSLKLRLRPGKDGPVEPILAELEAANFIRSYQHEGRWYGLVRNFRRFQRPKKPNSIHFIPAQFRTYVGLTDDSSEPDDNDGLAIPQKGEIAPQMEDVGGRVKDEGRKEELADASLAHANGQSDENFVFQGVVKSWNLLAADNKLPAIQHLTEPRKVSLRLRLKELGGIEGWYGMLDKIRAGPHLLGQNDRGWTVSFDWVLSPKNLTKIMEGNFDARKNSAHRAGSIADSWDQFDAVVDEAKRRENRGNEALGEADSGGISRLREGTG